MMPWFPDSFLGSTLGWPWRDRAVYRALLDAQWLLGALPSDEPGLAAIVGCTVEELRSSWARVGVKFSLSPGMQLVNERLEEHRAVAFAKHHSAVEKGRKGGISKAKRSSAKAGVVVQLKPKSCPSYSPGSSSALASSPLLSSPSDTSQSLVSGGESVAKAPPASRGTRIPKDFELTESRRQYAADQGLDPNRVFQMFTTYWQGKAGAGGCKINWDSTWQHWCLKDAEKNVRRDAPRKTRFDQLMEDTP